MSEWEELRQPPSDQIWMKTEQIGVSYGFIVWLFVAAALVVALCVALP